MSRRSHAVLYDQALRSRVTSYRRKLALRVLQQALEQLKQMPRSAARSSGLRKTRHDIAALEAEGGKERKDRAARKVARRQKRKATRRG